MTSFRQQRRTIVFSSAAIATALHSSRTAFAAVTDEIPLNAQISGKVVYLQVKKVNAKTGEVYTRECTGALIGKDGWIVTAAHPISAPILDSNTKTVIPTQSIPEISGSVGERREKELEELRAHVVNDKLDIALLQFKNYNNPRERFPFGRSSDVNVNDDVFVSGFMYGDKPRTTRKMQVESKGGASPTWNLNGEAAPGFSGAPVLNKHGHLVAVLIGGDRRKGGGIYALPINLILEMVGPAEAIYADDQSAVTSTGSQAGAIPKSFPHKFRAPPILEEAVIRRPFVQTYLVPMAFDIVSASFSVERQMGLADGPMVTITERNVIIAYSLESGPKSSGRIGWLEGAVTMDLVKK